MSNYTFVEETGDGVKTVYTFGFTGLDIGYLRPEDVHVSVDGELVPYTLDYANPNQVEFVIAPSAGAKVVIQRIMPKDLPYSIWQRGNAFSAENVRNSFLQIQYTLQEMLDGFSESASGEGQDIRNDLNMHGFRVHNLGSPVFPEDAVRLIDLQGGGGEPTNIHWADGLAWEQLVTPIPLHEWGGEAVLTFTGVLDPSNEKRFLCSEEVATNHRSLWFDATHFYLHDHAGVEQSVDSALLNIPVNELVEVKVNHTVLGNVHYYSLEYNGVRTQELASTTVTGSWVKFFGSGVDIECIFGSITSKRYQTVTLDLQWTYVLSAGNVVPCNVFAFRGVMSGDDSSWIPDNPDEGLEIAVQAQNVHFNSTGTGFPTNVENVDDALNFLKEGEVTPPMVSTEQITNAHPNTYWIPNSTIGASSIILPSDTSGWKEGDFIEVRDGLGNASEHNIAITRNGNTIDGYDEDLIIATNYGWCKIVFLSNNIFRVSQASVGAKLREPTLEILSKMMPVGHIDVSTSPTAPEEKFGFGVWRAYSEGRTLVGVGQGDDGSRTKDISAGEEGGEYMHLLTVAELPEHQHPSNLRGRWNNPDNTSAEFVINSQSTGNADDPDNQQTGVMGGNQAHNIMQPYSGTYFWERVQ